MMKAGPHIRFGTAICSWQLSRPSAAPLSNRRRRGDHPGFVLASLAARAREPRGISCEAGDSSRRFMGVRGLRKLQSTSSKKKWNKLHQTPAQAISFAGAQLWLAARITRASSSLQVDPEASNRTLSQRVIQRSEAPWKCACKALETCCWS